MSTNIEYAVFIRGVQTGDGIHDNEAIGLRGGNFAWITGRPGWYPGTDLVDAPTDYWKEGIIVKDGLGKPTVRVEISDGGSYGSMSGLELKISLNVLQDGAAVTFTSLMNDPDTGFNLTRKLTDFYVIIDKVFYKWSVQYTENLTWGDQFFTLSFLDPAIVIHKDTPHNVISAAVFPTAPSNSLNKVVPIAIGNITNAKLIPVTGAALPTTLAVSTGINSKQYGTNNLSSTYATNWTGSFVSFYPGYLYLYTPGITFGTNDPRLVGRQSGTVQFSDPLISGNSITVTGFFGDNGGTGGYPFSITQAFTTSNAQTLINIAAQMQGATLWVCSSDAVNNLVSFVAPPPTYGPSGTVTVPGQSVFIASIAVTGGATQSNTLVQYYPQPSQVYIASSGQTNTSYYPTFITSNCRTGSTAEPGHGGAGITACLLYDFFRDDNSVHIDLTSHVGIAPNLTTFWFAVVQSQTYGIVSEGVVNSFPANATNVYGFGNITGFDSTTQEYIDLSYRQISAFTNLFYNTPYPSAGFFLYPDNPSGLSVKNYVPISIFYATNHPFNYNGTPIFPPPVYSPPNLSRFVSSHPLVVTIGSVVDTFPLANQALLPNLFTFGYSLFYQRSVVLNHGTGTTSTQITYNVQGGDDLNPIYEDVVFDVSLPQGIQQADGTFPGFQLEAGEKIFLSIDFDILGAIAPAETGHINVTGWVEVISEYGLSLYRYQNGSGDAQQSFLETTFNSTKVYDATTIYQFRGVSNTLYPSLPVPQTAKYFNNNIDIDPNGGIYTVLTQPNFNKASYLRVHLQFYVQTIFDATLMPSNVTFGFKLYNVALFRGPDAYNGDKYARVTGVEFETDWDGTRVPTDPILAPSDAVQYFIRVQDGAGDFVDVSSFNNYAVTRPAGGAVQDWTINQQVDEVKLSSDWMQDIAICTFGAIVPGLGGLRRLVPIDYFSHSEPDVSVQFDTRNIIDGSVGDASQTGLDRLYTSVDFNYNYNPASGNFDNRFAVLFEDEDSFPLESAVIPGTIPPVPLWTTWVIGCESWNISGTYRGAYADAKNLWQTCHAAYLLAGRKNPYKQDLKWFGRVGNWNPVIGQFDAPYWLAGLIMSYLSVQWIDQPFSVPVTAINLQTQLMDRVVFGDYTRTDGLLYYYLVTQLALDTTKGELNFVARRRNNDPNKGTIGSPTPPPIRYQVVLPGMGIDEYQVELSAATIWEVVRPT